MSRPDTVTIELIKEFSPYNRDNIREELEHTHPKLRNLMFALPSFRERVCDMAFS